jgi:hypothetical protein
MTSKKRNTIGAGIVLIISIVFSAAKPVPSASPAIVHKVKKGESVSLICIRYYGHYTAAMGSVVLKMNASVKDINLILAGQKLALPDTASPAAKVPAAAPALAFEKTVNATQGVVTWVEGKAFVTAHDGTPEKKLSVNTLVTPGDIVETGRPGRVEIIINRESVVRMKENTRLTIEAFRDNAGQKGSTKVGFALGTVWAKVRKFRDAVSRFQLELPTAIAGVHGTVYETDVYEDSSAEVKVFNGEVAVKKRNAPKNGAVAGPDEVPGPDEVGGPEEVSVEQWTKIVQAMQKLTIDPKGVPSQPETFAQDSKDTWEKWNEERDEQIEEIFKE